MARQPRIHPGMIQVTGVKVGGLLPGIVANEGVGIGILKVGNSSGKYCNVSRTISGSEI